MKKIQNKGVQKNEYLKHQIPTAIFEQFSNIQNLKFNIASPVRSRSGQNNALALPFVWKCTEFGYDGYGVKVIRSLSDLDSLPNLECIAEEIIPFKNELAVIVVRSVSGEIKTYPVVEMEFHPEANQVEYVICPARIDEKVAQKAQAIALKVAEVFEPVGLLAVEMFQTQKDEIIVNEIAPQIGRASCRERV